MDVVILQRHREGETRYAVDQVVTGLPDAKAADRIACALARPASEAEVAAAGDAAIAYVEPIDFGLGGAPEPEPAPKSRRRKPAAAKTVRRARKPKAAEPE